MNTIYKILFILAFVPLSALGSVSLPRLFASSMVMQRETEAPIWGTAKPNSTVKIKVSWAKATVVTRADSNGAWRTTVATPEAGGPHTISFTDGDGTTLTLDNILMGEVWLCAGQSNMEMPVEGFKGMPVDGSAEELMDCQDGELRILTVSRKSSFEPLADITGEWKEANPEAVRQTSAVAYFFAKRLRRMLGVPVGVIITSWGGSSCEAWMDREWLEEFPELLPENNVAGVANLYVIPQSASDVKSKNRTPSVLYNGMLHPFIGIAMKGVIWYQGEDNVPRYGNYARLMKRMIEGWRTEWGIGAFPFYYCQIAPYDYSLINWDVNSALLREQQAIVERTTENVGMAVLLDAGLDYNIHPSQKRVAGDRLALLALANTYAVQGLPETARFEATEVQGDTVLVKFSRSRMWIYLKDGRDHGNFEVAGADGVFYPAHAWTYRNLLMVRSEKVAEPLYVRYCFKNWAQGDLYSNGLPISSFRTDTLEITSDTSNGEEYDHK